MGNQVMTHGKNRLRVPVKVALPTLEQLNKQSTSKVMLVMMRCLYTSDFSFMYYCFTEETIKDILNVADAMLQLDQGDENMPEDCTDMTEEERMEFLMLVETMREYGGHD